ncbi:MAG TPA: PAS domain S-box protein [Amaricoccus sp.]|nr:PAS domain S-box protein [Amaricoccus sp.]
MAREILQSLPVAVCATDAEGRVEFCNDALVALFGRRPEVGAARWEALPFMHPDGRAMRWEESALARALAGGAPVRVGALAVAEGGRRLELRSFAAPVRDGAGALAGGVEVILAVEDVDASGRVVNDLARLAAIVASSDDAIISKTLNGTVTSWNRSATRIFGYEPEEMIGQSITRIIPSELQVEEESILARLRRGERIDHFDTVRRAKDGRRVFVSLTVSPVRNAAGEIVGASKVARDVTDRKRAEELQQLLLGELSHRVKNTLAIIQAIARQSLRLEPEPRAFVESFTGRLQALARAHDVLVRGRMQRVELGELLREQVDFGAHDQRIGCSGPLVTLEAQAALQLALALHELSTNARKYGALSTPAGRLAVRWSTGTAADGREELRLEWRESGAGAPAAGATPGFGTQLIERSLVASGGRVEISHLPDGIGCDITLPLPEQAAETAAPSLPAAEPVSTGDPLAGLRILVVEDEALIAMDIEERLLAAGGEVVGPAATHAEARRLIAEGRADAALVDANLAGTRVDDLAVELRRLGVPFAFATGFGRGSLPQDFLDVPVLAKPFGSDALVRMVQMLLAGRRG